MKKSSFVAMVMSTIGGILAAIGMCMCLLPEWNAFNPGVAVAAVGIVVLIAMVITWRKMTNKAPIHMSGKAILTIILGIVGALLLGVGMCLAMVWGHMAFGIVVGIVGIVLLIFLIPLVKGIK